jgi:hypothetical protein
MKSGVRPATNEDSEFPVNVFGKSVTSRLTDVCEVAGPPQEPVSEALTADLEKLTLGSGHRQRQW